MTTLAFPPMQLHCKRFRQQSPPPHLQPCSIAALVVKCQSLQQELVPIIMCTAKAMEMEVAMVMVMVMAMVMAMAMAMATLSMAMSELTLTC